MTHFNKGPSYGLSAEVKNKVRVAAARGIERALSAPGRRGRDATRRDAGLRCLRFPRAPSPRGGGTGGMLPPPAPGQRCPSVVPRPAPPAPSAAAGGNSPPRRGLESRSAPGGPRVPRCTCPRDVALSAAGAVPIPSAGTGLGAALGPAAVPPPCRWGGEGGSGPAGAGRSRAERSR